MTVDKLHIQLLDGSTAWVPIDVKGLGENIFEILTDTEYTEYADPLYVFEFYPGDTVESGQQIFSNGTRGLIAAKLIKAGQWPDRKLNEFKFKGTTGTLTISTETADEYKIEREQIKKDHESGQFYYPKLIETIEKLDKLRVV
jgi:hypothetical protein